MNLGLSFCLTIGVILGGSALTYVYDRRAGLLARLAAGVCTGMAAWGMLGYALALYFQQLTPLTVIVAALLFSTPLSIFAFRGPRAALKRDVAALFNKRKLRKRGPVIGTLAGFAALLTWLFVIVFYERGGDWYTDNHFNLGDLAFHLAITQSFAVGQHFPLQHPEFAGVKLTYPFLVDFIPAQYAVCGASLPGALALQNIPLALSLVILLFRWAMGVTRNRAAALLTLPLLFFCGGFGFALFFRDAWNSFNFNNAGSGVGDFLFHLPKDYTRGGEYALAWGNLITTLLMTQRGMLFALPMALLTLTFLQRRGRMNLCAAGCVTGLIPLLHGHTFLAMLLIAGIWAAWDLLIRRRWNRLSDWVCFFAPAFILAAPQILVLANGSAVKPGTFFGFQPGWDMGPENLKWFGPYWLWNLGLFLPLLIAAFYWHKANGKPLISRRLRIWYAPFILLFILPNLFRFAPWIWDNIKILIYFYLGSAPLVALVVAALWRRRRRGGKIWASIALFSLCFSGVLDVWRIASLQQEHQIFGKNDLAFADFLRRNTPSDARILAAPYFAHPVLLSGRPSMLGYEGHLWSHGLDFKERSAETKRIYAGEPDADALIRKLRIQYVIVGPPERNERGFKLNEVYFARYPLVGEANGYKLYRTLPSP